MKTLRLILILALLSRLTACTQPNSDDEAHDPADEIDTLRDLHKAANDAAAKKLTDRDENKKRSAEEKKAAAEKERAQKALVRERGLFAALAEKHSTATWPPTLGRTFPDVALIDSRGTIIQMKRFHGKVCLVEFAAMTSPMSQALAGSGTFGAFGQVEQQPGFKALQDYFPEFTGGIGARQIGYVQLVLTDLDERTPSLTELQGWQDHFQLLRKGYQVFTLTALLRKRSERNLAPGFMLLDRDSIVRVDTTSVGTPSNLFKDLMPMIKTVLNEQKK